ncbi:LamG-like jellyroll fold domain-containing protein [Lewinella sp. IMCC34183]|uniref:LamG-like jellyroll fold domain-containing protein n=1 Tax=Lewinella sp. IMCC34183 TaxID=2248762 RepID=UPI000E244DC3|nr:LamG-like jellyroll fold domain-containing protein [Lewinella sp. IMCC34183]
MQRFLPERDRVVASLTLLLCLVTGFQVTAQAPGLPIRASLDQPLLSQTTFTGSDGVDTVMVPHTLGDAYSLNVVAAVTAAEGRGLDIEARDGGGSGFRLSLDEATLNWTADLSDPTSLSLAPAGNEQEIRVAVSDGQAHIYRNGRYLASRPLAAISNLIDGNATGDSGAVPYGPNLIADWAGTATDRDGTPADYGWSMNTTTVNLFNTANSGSGVRFMDFGTNDGYIYDGSAYTGRLMYIRWDGDPVQSATYAYPVELAANTTYQFSLLQGYLTNARGARSISVGIGPTDLATDRTSETTFFQGASQELERGTFTFRSGEAGTYYLTITGSWGLYTIGELSLQTADLMPRFLFGKNYPDGAVDMEIISATYAPDAYAPEPPTTGNRETITVTAEDASFPTSYDTDFVVPGKTDLHFTGESVPFVNSTVDLQSSDSWLFFDNVKPSEVAEEYLQYVTLNGAPADLGTNVRLSIYVNGAVVIPYGADTYSHALEAYAAENLDGEMTPFELSTFHNDLGTLDDNVASFKLHRGFMATLASNPDGSGFSRVFIANDEDLIVNTLPEGLDGTVSYIRVFRWDWPSKKGKAGWSPDQIGATWYYDWNIGGTAGLNWEYVAIRQNCCWPSWDAINNKSGINHLLGFNEPDRPDQSDMTIDEIMEIWPEFMQSGYRLGSPAPADPFNSVLPEFIRRAEEKNYRVDYLVIHAYWGGLSPQDWYNRLKNLYDRYQRPIWITEWNNGANWTNEYWPEDQDEQFAKQRRELEAILEVLDTTPFVERYAIYDWVEDKRALVLGDTLTPAGKMFYAKKSEMAFNPAYEFIHTWQLAMPDLVATVDDDDYFLATLTWEDLNGELGSRYELERKFPDDDDWTTVATYEDYEAGSTLTYQDSIYSSASYRVKAFGPDGSEFLYSNILDIDRDADPQAPALLTAAVRSSEEVYLSWTESEAARSYTLKRSMSAGGPFETIAARTTLREYTDTGLTPGTTYYYVVTALNSAGESENSRVVTATTPELAVPNSPLNPRIAAGDERVTLSWDFQYDAVYQVQRADSKAGPYVTLASDVDALEYVDVNVTNGTTYYYRVVASNEIGESEASMILEATPTDGRYVYLPFNEPTGTFAEDVWGGQHATLVGDAGREAGYVRGGALSLSGGHTYLPAGVVSTLQDFTIATWIELDELSTWARVFDFGTGTTTNMFLTPRAGGSPADSTIMRYAIRNGDGEMAVSYTTVLQPDTWTHVAVSQHADTVRLFIGGEMVAMMAGVTLSPADLGQTTQNYIGKSQYPDPPLRGAVDEFKIYNYALSEAELQEAMAPTDEELELAIEGLKANASDGRVTLTWVRSFDGMFGVLRSDTETGTYDTLAVDITGNQYTDTSVMNGNMYYYRVFVYNDAGASDKSKTVMAMPVKGRHVHIDFNEGSGQIAKDQWAGYDATLYSTASWTVGRRDSELAVRLDRLQAAYLDLDDGVVSDLDSMTLATWVWIPADIGNNSRIFDFGTSTGNYMMLSPNSGGQIRFKMTTPDRGGYDQFINYQLPKEEWTYVAVTLQDSVFSLYVDGRLQYSDSTLTLTPADIGMTTNNYLGRSQWSSDPYTDLRFDDLKIFTYALNEEELLENMKLTQVITFEEIEPRFVGDENFYLEASVSSGLDLTYESSDSSVAIVDMNGLVSLIGAGSTTITVSQAGTEEYAAASASRVLYVDTDSGTGFDDPQAAGTLVRLFPNPVTAHLLIQMETQVQKGATITVVATNGRTVLQRTLSGERQTLDVRALPRGVYIAVIRNGSSLYYHKLVKQ